MPIEVLSPNGKETWIKNRSKTILWKCDGKYGDGNIELHKDGKFFGYIAEGIALSKERFVWDVGACTQFNPEWPTHIFDISAPSATGYKVCISIGDKIEDCSSNTFTIAQ